MAERHQRSGRDVNAKEVGDSEVSIQTLAPQRVVSAVLRQLNKEQIEAAIACFATEFRYNDHGIGLEFRDKGRLAEFFRNTRERYADCVLQADQTFVSGEHVITQRTLQVTMTTARLLTRPMLRRYDLATIA